jgi:hypothetical protein
MTRDKKSCHLVEMTEEKINLKQLASSTSPNKDNKQKKVLMILSVCSQRKLHSLQVLKK